MSALPVGKFCVCKAAPLLQGEKRRKRMKKKEERKEVDFPDFTLNHVQLRQF